MGHEYTNARITNHESRITNHESRITNHELRITNHELRITNHESFEEIPHTADVALRVWGQDLRELFASAARGLAWLMADPDTVQPEKEVALDLTAPDAETLLVTWLGELIYLNERDGVVFTEFDLEEVTPTHLRGTARGGRAGEIRRLIKAVTFSNLAIRPTDRGLETTITFDV